MEILQEYIRPELIILIPVCWGLGLVMKSIKQIPNSIIPLINLILVVGVAATWVLSQTDATLNPAGALFSIFTQGIVAWLAGWVTYDKWIKGNLEGGDN